MFYKLQMLSYGLVTAFAGFFKQQSGKSAISSKRWLWVKSLKKGKVRTWKKARGKLVCNSEKPSGLQSVTVGSASCTGTVEHRPSPGTTQGWLCSRSAVWQVALGVTPGWVTRMIAGVITSVGTQLWCHMGSSCTSCRGLGRIQEGLGGRAMQDVQAVSPCPRAVSPIAPPLPHFRLFLSLGSVL